MRPNVEDALVYYSTKLGSEAKLIAQLCEYILKLETLENGWRVK